MQTRRNTWPVLALAASVAVVPLLTGCDTRTGKADTAVIQGVAKGPAYNQQDADAKVKDLDALTKSEGTSPPRQAIAKAALAGAEMDAARLGLAELQQTEGQINQLVWQMEQTATQLRVLKANIDAAKKQDPAVPLEKEYQGEKSIADALAKKAAAAKSGDQPWIKGDNVSLANAAQAKAKVDELQGKIDKIKGDVDALTKQRDAAADAASKAQQQAEGGKGDEASKAFVAAAEARKQAAMLNIQIEQANASLVPLTQDQAAAKAQLEQVTAAAAAFEASAKIYTDQYANIAKGADEMTTAAKALLDGDKDSLKTRAVKVNELVAKASMLRNDVIEKLKAAEAHYKAAVADSDSVRKSLGDPKPDTPEATLVELRTKVHEAANLRLRQAEASTMLAAVHASHAGVLTRRQSAAASAAAAATPLALSVPAEAVDAKIEDELKEAKASAEAAYAAADDLLQNVSEGATGTPATRSAAKLERAIVAAGRAQLATTAGDTENARKYKDEARGYQKQFQDEPNGLSMPKYLMVITETQPVVTPTPAVTPTTKPAAPTTPAATAPVETPKPGETLMNEK
jgi:hypothetical protein